MKRLIPVCVFLLFTPVFSSQRPEPDASVSISHVGSFTDPVGKVIVRIHQKEKEFIHNSDPRFPNFEPVAIPAGKTLPKAIVTVHRFNGNLLEYKKIYQFEIPVNQIPQKVFVDHSGERIAFAYVEGGGPPGLRVFTNKGQTEKFWSASSLLGSEYKHIGFTANGPRWFEEGRFRGDDFYFNSTGNPEFSSWNLEHPEQPISKLDPDLKKRIFGVHFVLNIEKNRIQEMTLNSNASLVHPAKKEPRTVEPKTPDEK